MTLLYNIINITHGLFAGLACFIFFYLLGFFCLSEKFFVSLKFRAFPVFLGAAIFTIISWYGIQYHFAFDKIFPAVLILFATLLIIRIKQIIHWNYWKNFLKQNKTPIFLKSIVQNGTVIFYSTTFQSTTFWLFAYILLYTLTYLFLPTPSDDYLPIARVGNLDIFNYINTTQHLISLPPLNIAHASSTEPFPLYFDTPAVFYFHGWLSLFYHNNAMSACMPLLHNIAAAIGLLITYYCRRIFSCSRPTALCIAAIILSGVFYRYIIGFYFLSSLIATLVWLIFLIEMLSIDYSQPLKKRSFIYLFIVMRTYEWLLLLIYPVLFFANIFILMGVIGLMLFFTKPSRALQSTSGTIIKKACYYFFCLFLSAGLLFILNTDHYITHVIDNLIEFSERAQVVWGMPLLSPLAVLGLPSSMTLTGTMTPTLMTSTFSQSLFMISLFIFFIIALFYSAKKIYIWTPAENILFIMASSAFILYWFYFYHLGPLRYQPWKFASYFMLPLSCVFWAILAKTLQNAFGLKTQHKIFIFIAAFCVLGNFVFYDYPIKKLPKKYEQLVQLNSSKLVPGKDLVIKMSSDAATFLPVFFIPDKKLHFLSHSYYPKEDINTIPDDIPIFVESPQNNFYLTSQSNCHSDEKHYNIPHLGCLYFHFSTFKNETKQ